MTRHGQADLVVARCIRRPAGPCDPLIVIKGRTSKNLVQLDTPARQISLGTDVIYELCHPATVTQDPRRNTPKRKSP